MSDELKSDSRAEVPEGSTETWSTQWIAYLPWALALAAILVGLLSRYLANTPW